MTGRNAEVPAEDTKMVADAVMPAMKVGFAITKYPSSKSPVWGAAAGRSRVVTAMTTMKTAVKMDMKPAQVSQPMLWNLRTDAQRATNTVATKLNHTVQAPCVDKALKAIETPKIPAPAQRT